MSLALGSSSKLYITGHRGLVGSALWRYFNAQGFKNLIGFSSKQIDLTKSLQVEQVFKESRPDAVIMAAAKVGGIYANATSPVDFMEENLLIQMNTFKAAHQADVSRLLFLGSSCIYPKMASQPIHESELMRGELEKTNEAYALAKIAGIFHVRAYRNQYQRAWVSAMPTNLYGPGDNFEAMSSHALPALIARFHEAKINKLPEVTIWGSGKPKREFLHVDDLAGACHLVLEKYDSEEPINIGYGEDISIGDLALLISDIIGYVGAVEFDSSKPDGTPRKLLDSSKIKTMGWKPKISLRDGIAQTYEWYKENQSV